MLDEIRDHDPQPTAEEKLWTTTDPVRLIAKAVGLAAMAIAIGVSVSELVVSDPQPAQLTMGGVR